MNNTVDVLRNIYDDISRWLVYAEAKHIALITVALFFGSQFVDNFQIMYHASAALFLIALVLDIFVLFCSVVSFVPFLNQAEFMRRLAAWVYRDFDSDNILFYLAVFKMYLKGEDAYPNQVKSVLQISDLSLLEKQYIDQIRDVSRVATIKNAIFKLEIMVIVLVCILSGIIFFLIA